MRYRRLGRTGFDVSTVGFGAWAIGNAWGKVDDSESTSALRRALDLGVNFFDTADVYGDGRSERLLGELRRERKDGFYVATKAGRRLSPHDAAGYTRENLTRFVERSLENLGAETIDLLQLHCPPTEVYYRPEVFGALDALVREGKIRFYGVSVERVEEALKAIEYPGVQSVQIIYNVLRQRPADLFFAEAKRREVGVVVRLPLSSGLLTGKMRQRTTFEATDHRAFNRHGEAFDRGETFSGVDYALGLFRRRKTASLRSGRDAPFHVGARLDSAERRGHLHDPGREAKGAGGRERRRRRSAVDPAGDDERGARALHDARSNPSAPILVSPEARLLRARGLRNRASGVSRPGRRSSFPSGRRRRSRSRSRRTRW